MAILHQKNTLLIYKRYIKRDFKKMSKLARLQELETQEFNPFEIKDCKESLRENLDTIDNRDIRMKFKNTQDPINLAFKTIENTSLKILARDFVKETFFDFVSSVRDICK